MSRESEHTDPPLGASSNYTQKSVWQRRIPVILLGIGGVILSILGSRMLARLDSRDAHAEFERIAQYEISNVHSRVQRSMNILVGLRGLYASSVSVDREEFRAFVNTTAADLPDLIALEWVPRVRPWERAQFEAEVRKEFPDFMIWSQFDNKKELPEGSRDDYFPILYAEPWETNSFILGYDPSTEPVRGRGLVDSWFSDRMTTTERIVLLQPEDGPPTTPNFGFLSYLPVYRNGAPHGNQLERRENLDGMLLAVFEVREMVKQVVAQSSIQSQIQLHVFDIKAPEGQQLLYSESAQSAGMSPDSIAHDTHAEREFAVGDRSWLVIATPGQGYQMESAGPMSAVVLILGLVLTCITCAYVGMSVGQTEKVRELVIARTLDLDQANHRLRGEVLVRREAERARIESEQRMVAIFQSTLNGIITVNATGQIESVNHAVETMYGYSPDALIGEPCTLLMTDDYHEQFEGIVAQFIREDNSESIGRSFDMVGLRMDASTFPINLTVGRFQIGERELLTLVITDLTEKRAAEEQLQLFFTLSDDLFCILDADASFLRVSPAWRKFLGYNEVQLLGSAFHERVHPDDLARAQMATARLIEDGSTANFEARYRTQDGAYRWFSWSATALPDQHVYLATARDITQAKETEAELKRLVASQEKINLELRDFAYVVSHDLKAPLRGIITTAGWLKSDHSHSLDEDGLQLLDLLANRAGRMDRLIEGILQYSRIGRVQEPRECVDLEEVVDEVIDTLQAPSHITVTRSGTFPKFYMNRTRITQVLQNLVQNAIKYSDKPEGRIEVHAERLPMVWRLSVRDNGPGIDAKYGEKVFKMFQTLSSKDEKDSTGVGLAVVKKVIEYYGGRVWLESEPGLGATFFFDLSVGLESPEPIALDDTQNWKIEAESPSA